MVSRLTRDSRAKVRMRGMYCRIGEEEKADKRREKEIDVIEQRWPLSPHIPPTRPDRIKLLEDDRKYRGSTHSCRTGEERGRAKAERERAVTMEPRGGGRRGRGEKKGDEEERGGPTTPRNAVLQLLRSSCCVNVLIRSAWARPIRDTA